MIIKTFEDKIRDIEGLIQEIEKSFGGNRTIGEVQAQLDTVKSLKGQINGIKFCLSVLGKEMNKIDRDLEKRK